MQRRKTSWPVAVEEALQDAAKAGYLRAIEDVYAAILAGDLTSMLIRIRSREGLDDVQPLCLSLEQQIALSSAS